MNVSPRLSFFASNIRRRQQVEAARADREAYPTVFIRSEQSMRQSREERLMTETLAKIADLKAHIQAAAISTDAPGMASVLGDLIDPLNDTVTQEYWLERIKEIGE